MLFNSIQVKVSLNYFWGVEKDLLGAPGAHLIFDIGCASSWLTEGLNATLIIGLTLDQCLGYGKRRLFQSSFL